MTASGSHGERYSVMGSTVVNQHAMFFIRVMIGQSWSVILLGWLMIVPGWRLIF